MAGALVRRWAESAGTAIVAGAVVFLRLLVGLLVSLVALTGRADAYPQWQFSSGTSRCSQCHYSPAGGGLVNGYGRDAAADDLSTWKSSGDFLHGAVDLPSWLALGLDTRGALLVHDAGELTGSTLSYFPMQLDGYVRLALGSAFSVYASVGYRGQARSLDEPLGQGAAKPAAGSRIISREHYLMYRPAAMGLYVRAGRFFAPFGLRLAEHYAYVRRDLGFNTLEESYNLSAGYLQRGWELHLTAFAPDVVRDIGGKETGAAGMFEARFGDATAVGLQVRYGQTDDLARTTGGLFFKGYLESLKALLQTEANVVHSSNQRGAGSTNGLVGYLGLSMFPTRGLWVTPFVEHKQTSLAVRDSATTAGGLQLNWFPAAHFEVILLGRLQVPVGDSAAQTALLVFHYWL
jgi:hypothetical protein